MNFPDKTGNQRKQKTPAPARPASLGEAGEPSSVRGKTKQVFRKDGLVIEALPSAFFRVRLDDGKEILAALSGKIRLHRITILPGDRVSVEMTPYDDKRGRIVYRLK